MRTSPRYARRREPYALLKALLFCGAAVFGYVRYKDKFQFLSASVDQATARFISEIPVESPVYDKAARAEINRKAEALQEISPRRKPAVVELIAPRKKR